MNLRLRVSSFERTFELTHPDESGWQNYRSPVFQAHTTSQIGRKTVLSDGCSRYIYKVGASRLWRSKNQNILLSLCIWTKNLDHRATLALLPLTLKLADLEKKLKHQHRVNTES